MFRKFFKAIGQIMRIVPDTLHDIRLVASWDIVRQARRPSFFLLRTLIALIVSIQFIWTWYTSFEARSRAGLSNFSVSTNQIVYTIQTIYLGSVGILMVAVIVLCPILTVGVVAGDRERKIWYDLVNSPLSGWSILMGKMLGRLGTLLGWVMAVLPVWSILGLVGGLDPFSVLFGILTIMFYGWFYASIGLLASVLSRRTRDAVGLATGIVLLILFSPLLAILFMNEILGYQNLNPNLNQIFLVLYFLNPFSSMSLFTNSASVSTSGMSRPLFILAISAFGPFLTLISGLLLRPVGQRLESRENHPKKAPKRTPVSTEFKTKTADLFWRSDDDGYISRILFSAMAIKERKVRGSSRLTRALKSLILGIGLLTGLYYLLLFAPSAFREMLQYGFYSSNRGNRNDLLFFVMAVSAVMNVILLYSITMDTAGRLTTEKETDSWLTLLSTPIEPLDIFSSKALASIWGWRVPLLFLMVCWLIGLFTNAIHPISFACGVVVWFIQILFAITLGLFFGSKCRSFQAVSFRSVLVWATLQLIIPVLLSFMANTQAFFGIMPAFAAVGVLVINTLNQKSNSDSGLFLFGIIQIMVMFFTTISLFQLCLRSFDRWNDRTLHLPDHFDQIFSDHIESDNP